MARDINRVLSDIKNAAIPINEVALRSLSGINREEQAAFRTIWPQIDVARRREVIKTLNDLAESEVVNDFNVILREALTDEDAEVRAEAISGLWEDETPTLVGPLLRSLTADSSVLVRAMAADSLGRFLLLGELGEVDASVGFAVQESLLRTFHNTEEDIDVRCRALESLSYSGDAAVQDLLEAAYKDRDERLNISAIIGMGRSADPRWQNIVIRELESPNSEVRLEAARAAGELELSDAVHTLGEIAETDPEEEIRRVAIFSLGQIGTREARRIVETLAETETSELLLETITQAEHLLASSDDALDLVFYDDEELLFHLIDDDGELLFDFDADDEA